MALLLRGTDNRRWDWAEGDIPWLPAGEFPAAPLADLRTSPASSLSVWHIEDDRSNFDRVVAALAANRQHPDKFDYVLLDEHVLADAGLQAQGTRGSSQDPGANNQWHRDLVELTASKLVQLARLMYQHGVRDRVPEPKVKELIASAVNAGRIASATLQDQLRRAVLGS